MAGQGHTGADDSSTHNPGYLTWHYGMVQREKTVVGFAMHALCLVCIISLGSSAFQAVLRQ